MLKIRRSCDRIFNMGIPIPGKDGLYIETGLRWPAFPQGPYANDHGRVPNYTAPAFYQIILCNRTSYLINRVYGSFLGSFTDNNFTPCHRINIWIPINAITSDNINCDYTMHLVGFGKQKY